MRAESIHPTDGGVPRSHPRSIGWVGTTALAMGGSNQSLFLIGTLVVSQGSAAIPLLAIGLLLSLAAAPGWTELVLIWPNRVGGIAATCAEAFRPYSPVLANMAGVCYWWGWVPTCGLTAILSASALHAWYMPGVPIPALAAGLVVLFTAVNLCGVRWVTRVAIPIAVASATLAFISGLAPVIAGHVNWHQATSFNLITPFHGVFGQLTSAMAGLYLIGFAAPAFEAAACHVGETVNPGRNLPRAMLASAAMATLYFLVLPVIWLGVLGSSPLQTSLTTSLGPTFAPLFGAGAHAAATGFLLFNMFHGTIQPLAGASRTLMQIAEDGLIPRIFALRSRTDTPWVATLVTAGMAIVLLLLGDPTSFIAAANLAYLVGIALPNVAVWLLRRNAPDIARPYRAPRGMIGLGLAAAVMWGVTTIFGFEEFGLPTVLAGFSLCFSAVALYAFRRWEDRRRAGLRRQKLLQSLHVKLTGAMLIVLGLDAAGYYLAVSSLAHGETARITALEDIFVAVALFTLSVGLILPGIIAHATHQVADAADRLATGTLADLRRAMQALSVGNLDAAHATVDIHPVSVRTRDELGVMAASFNTMQAEAAAAATALDGAREGLREARATTRSTLEAVRESEELFRTAFNQAATGNVLVALDGSFLRVNATLCALLGYTETELLTKSVHAITYSGDLNQTREVIEGLLNGEFASAQLEKRYVHADGHLIWAQVDVAAIVDEASKPRYFINRIQDIGERKRAEEALRESEERYRDLFENATDIVFTTDLKGRFTSLNKAAERISGYTRSGALTLSLKQLLTPESVDLASRMMTETLAGTSTPTYELVLVAVNGRHVPLEVSTRLILHNGAAVGIQGIGRDIHERKQTEEADRRLASIVQAASDGIMSTTLAGTITSWNAGAQRLYGYTAAEVIGGPVSILFPAERAEEAASLLERIRAGDSVRQYETVRLRKDGRLIDVAVSMSPIYDASGRITGTARSHFDISERKHFEDQLKHQALHDALTKLPNRTLLYDRLEQVVLTARRTASSVALLLMDLDRFKDVNDTLGHQAGDSLLGEVAFRLRGVLRDSDTVARLGGDEFAVILPNVDELRSIQVANTLQTALRQPLILEGHRIDINASVGIALFPAHGDDATTLLRHADVAMYAAKRSGGNHAVYTSDHDLNSPARLALVADLRHAIDHDQLVLHYQPKVAMASGLVKHLEALVRWQHPEHGMISPGEFISLAEETGLIEPLTLWVIKTALQQCADWKWQGLDVAVAVNLSARSLHDSSLPGTIAWLLRSSGVGPESLIVEITESSLMVDPDGALAILQEMHDMGLSISIDDFGTGYSSLAYLKRLPVDEIKIDRSFVLSMARSGTVIVRSVIDLGHNLGLTVTAEGVEDEETWHILSRMGCEMAQGYHISRPIPAGEIVAWVRAFGHSDQAIVPGRDLILVVDDNPVYQELLTVLLSNGGYEVLTAGTGEEALATARSIIPALILTDVQLPGMSGLELVRRIRAETVLNNTVTVAMTGSPRAEDEEYARRVGCDVYMAKPSSTVDLLRLVRHRLAA